MSTDLPTASFSTPSSVHINTYDFLNSQVPYNWKKLEEGELYRAERGALYLEGSCNKASYGCLEHLFSRFTPLLCHLLPSCFLPAKADILCLFSSKGPVHAYACRDTQKQLGGGGLKKDTGLLILL